MRGKRKVLSVLMAAVLAVTGIIGSAPFTAELFAATVKSSDDMIMHFDLGYGNGLTGTDYYCKDYYSNSYMKTYSWSGNSAAYQEVVDGEGRLFNGNGYIYADVSNSALSGSSAWRLELKFQNDYQEQPDNLLIALGSAVGAGSIDDADTADILRIHQGGRIFIGNQEINDSSANEALKLMLGEKSYYSVVFNASTEYLTITKDGHTAFQMHLNADQISSFEQVGFISMGCYNASNSQNDIGKNSGTLRGYYYYLRAYSEPQLPETVGKIATDAVIYTHGENIVSDNWGYSDDYGWMMYGTQVADGTVEGEQKTEFTLPYGAVLENIYCPDSSALQYDRGDGAYYLTGSFSPDKYRVADGEEVYTDIRFQYSLNGRSYIEYHRFCVKTNPVPTHGMIYAQAYSGSVQQNNKSAVAFQTAALGSVGSNTVGSSLAKTTGWTCTNAKSQTVNSWNIWAPFSTDRQCYNDDNGSLWPVYVGQKDSADTVDKNTGFAGIFSQFNSSAYATNWVDGGIDTEYAKYYVDKSADSILGAKHTAGEDTYSIELFTENLSQRYSGGQVNIVQHELHNAPSSMRASTDNLLGENAWNDDNGTRANETVTITGSISDGSARPDYWTAAQNISGNNAKATIITHLDITVFDKTSPRNVYDNETVADHDSSCYDVQAWREYSDARLALEGLLNNYEVSAVDDTYVQTLKTKYENLGEAADYSALIAAIMQAEDILSKSDIYASTDSLTAAVASAKEQAFDGAALDGEHIVKDQQTVDQITRELQFTYTETVLNKANIKITFNVYLDDKLVGSAEKQCAYMTELTLDSEDLLSGAAAYNVVKWTHGGITVATDGTQYTVKPKTKGVYSCYLISTPEEGESLCRVELFDINRRRETEFYIEQSKTYADVISTAQSYTQNVLYYAISGWEIDGMTDYNISDSLAGKDSIQVYPLYTPTVSDYTMKVTGGNMESENGFVFDARTCIAFDEDNNAGEFLCWAVKFDEDDSYRVVSYNSIYDFYVSGNMDFVAVTDLNFDHYKDKLQANTTELDDTPRRPTLEELKNKKAIPSLRGPIEDSASVSGAFWDQEQHKLFIVAQVADGAEYDTCGVVSMMNGRTMVSPSASQTKSGQYIISYRFSASYADRTLTVYAYSKSGAQGDDIIYSPSIDIKIPGDESVVTIGNSNNCSVSYDLLSGKYNMTQNNESVLANVTAEFTDTASVKYDVSDYTSHKAEIQEITDGAGNATQLTVTSKKSGWPTVEQIFKTYDDKDYVLTQMKIYHSDGSEIGSNYIAPVVVSGNTSFKSGSAPWTTFLYTPYDNDSWSRFQNYSLYASGGSDCMSHEVSAIYDPVSKKGLVIGSATHDTWKTGVEYTGSVKGISGLKAYGGARTIEISSESTYRGWEEHGVVKGTQVSSPMMFIGDYSDWKYGMMQFADANTSIVPARTEGDLGGVPFGWNSWGSIADSLTTDNALGNVNKIKEEFQAVWETDENGTADGTPVVMNLDSWWNEIKLDNGDDDPWNDNEPALKAFVAQCEANGQIPGIYHTPFVTWCSEEQLNDPDEAWWTHPERVLRKPDGTMYDSIDGGFPLDPTNPDVIQENVNRINYFKSLGFKYVKIDFLTHGTLEGQFYNSDITTGMQAFNYGMQAIVDACNEGDSNMFINYSIAPLFPYQYANGRRMGCDCWYSTDDTQYTLNQVTYGFWEEGIYNYPDPDHAVIYGRDGGATEGESKNVMTLNAIVAGNFMLGDSFTEYQYTQTILGINRTVTYNPAPAIERARKYVLNSEVNEVAKKGKTFKPVTDSTPEYANVYRMEDNGDIYYAVFNFSGTNTYRLEIPTNYYYSCKELWSGDYERDGANIWAYIDVTLSGTDSKIYKFSPTDPF